MDKPATDDTETDDHPRGDDEDYEITYKGLPLPHIVMQGHGIRRPWDF